MCSVQRVMHPAIMEEQKEDQSMKAFMKQCMPLFDHNYVEDEEEVNKRMPQAKEGIEQGYMKEDKVQNEEDDNEEEDDVDKYYDPTPSPPTQFQWYHCQELEVSYDSDNALSTSMQQPSAIPSFNPNNHEGPPLKNASIVSSFLIVLVFITDFL